MTQPWFREHTQEWISQLENRLEDIDYYLNRTVAWCEERGITDDQTLMSCAFITCIWVSHMRNEPISYSELLEFVGLSHLMNDSDDKIYGLGSILGQLDHEEVLQLIAGNLRDF
jgi:hypothetical protein